MGNHELTSTIQSEKIDDDIVGVKGRNLQISTNRMANVVTIREKIHYCIEKILLPLIVEIDCQPIMKGSKAFGY